MGFLIVIFIVGTMIYFLSLGLDSNSEPNDDLHSRYDEYKKTMEELDKLDDEVEKIINYIVIIFILIYVIS